MKSVFISLLIILTSFQAEKLECFNPIPTPSIEQQNLLSTNWTGNEDNLFLQLTLPKELEFPKNYTQIRAKEGVGCEIDCNLIKGAHLKSPEGYELKEMKIKIEVVNAKESDKVNAFFDVQYLYEGVDKGVRTTSTRSDKYTQTVTNPSLNVNFYPTFEIEKEKNKGLLVFKNAYPYRDIKK